MAPASLQAGRRLWAIALIVLVMIWTTKFLLSPMGKHEVAPPPLPKVAPVFPKPPMHSEATGGGANVAAGTPAENKDASPASDTLANITERPLILYAYSDTPNARSNLVFFLAHGLHQSADFVFIMNGNSSATDLIPDGSNIRIVQRENDCYDLGAHAEVLTTGDLYKGYKRYILMNASIRGPFLPAWATGCWSEMFLSKITDTIKLAGMSVNCQPLFHVQSMVWATDRVGVELLLFPPADPTLPADAEQEVGINSCFHTWETAVHAEIYSTQIILKAGYNVTSMMTAFHAKKTFIEDCDNGGHGDALWNGRYYGTNVHPYETIFMKANRDIDHVLIDRLTEWTDGSGYSSYDFC